MFLGMLIYIEVGQGSHEGPMRVEGAPRGVGAPPCLVLSLLLS